MHTGNCSKSNEREDEGILDQVLSLFILNQIFYASPKVAHKVIHGSLLKLTMSDKEMITHGAWKENTT